METLDAIKARVSVRKFSKRPIDKVLLEKLIDAARRAPTARAVEPWEFIVILKRETLGLLGGLADHGLFIREAAACIVVVCADTKYYLEDGCAATENILLAAADLGLGACWVAGDKKEYADNVLKAIKAPQGYRLISLIPVGWPGEPVKQSKKKQLNDVIHWEVF